MKKAFLCVIAALLCVLLCLGLSFTAADVAYASDDQPSVPSISIQVGLPDGWTAESDMEADSQSEANEPSGGTEVIVNGKRYTTLSSGTLNFSLTKLGCTSEQASTQEAGETVDTAVPDPGATAGPETADTPDTASAPETADTSDTAEGTDTAESSESPADSDGQEPEAGTSDPDAAQGSTDSAGLTPDGQGTVVDNASSESGKQFYTVYTQDENVFYLIIDNERDSDNVYFLDTVKESDLLSLSEKDAGADAPSQSAVPDPEPVCTCVDKCAPGEVDTNCPVCVLSWKDCTGKETVDAAPPEPEPEKSGGNTMILVLIAMAAVGGAGYYFKIYKPKKDLDDADDFDDLTDADGEETVNEDEEPEEPAYPEGYGDDDM